MVKDQDGIENMIHMCEWKFLPNCMFMKIRSLISDDAVNRCELLHSRSAYEMRKNFLSQTCTNIYKYPVVYAIKQDDTPTLLWSSRNDRGHFGVSKVIFRKATPIIGTIKDANGLYGMTEWTFAIVASETHHDDIIACIRSLEFKKIVQAISLRNEICLDILKQFKSRFWECI
jgi:hypothetical protein